MTSIIFLILIGLVLYAFSRIFKKRKWHSPTSEIDAASMNVLNEYVDFYKKLNATDKKQFEFEVQEFLLNYKITPISTTITDKERILIAASGVIPMFAFPDWKYLNLTEILVYPDTFDTDYDVKSTERNILGMVGSGAMSYKMILSKHAINNGFARDNDAHNTAIHEFVHLIDGMDGEIDGMPEVLLQQPYIMPWLNLINNEINKIHKNQSELNAYGATNAAEFFAVACEYFFEKPKQLSQQHPQLYAMLDKMFNQQLNRKIKVGSKPK